MELKIIFTNRLIKENHVIKKWSKYVTVFDYINKILIVLGATSSGVSIISFTSIVRTPIRIVSASLTLIFFFYNRNYKKVTEYNKKKKKERKNMIKFLCWLKVN